MGRIVLNKFKARMWNAYEDYSSSYLEYSDDLLEYIKDKDYAKDSSDYGFVESTRTNEEFLDDLLNFGLDKACTENCVIGIYEVPDSATDLKITHDDMGAEIAYYVEYGYIQEAKYVAGVSEYDWEERFICPHSYEEDDESD